MTFKLPPYPRTFWVLFWGLFINRISASLVWPFLTLYMRDTLEIPLTVTAFLITLQALSGLASTAVVSPLMDRAGRKKMMVLGLVASSATLVVMSQAHGLLPWVILVIVYGAVNQIFNIGSNAMVADLVQPKERPQAYALIRMIANLGIAIGPAVGGLLIKASSFSTALNTTAVVNFLLAVVVWSALPETIPQLRTKAEQQADGGFLSVIKDRLFIVTWGLYVLSLSAPSMIFALLLIYVKTHFEIREDQFSLLVTINAGMVVLFQYAITRFTIRFRPYPVMAAGALLYALGVGSIGLGTTFAAFAMSMVILTLGELLINPTVTALVANIAPTDKRARYLGVLSMSYPVASGFAPVIGGLLGDTIAPRATWFGGMAMAGMAAFGFYR
ncbi:MAG: MFS transporter, partial [Anaerolineae bacterium]|nr:MFS transporter [Anaerolineae bacterium]